MRVAVCESEFIAAAGLFVWLATETDVPRLFSRTHSFGRGIWQCAVTTSFLSSRRGTRYRCFQIEPDGLVALQCFEKLLLLLGGILFQC